MKFIFHGGAGEVGKSCIEVDGRFLLDCGLKITEDGTVYPKESDNEHIKAVFLSHAHLDHCGALPLFNKNGLNCSIFCNSMTQHTAKILMKDSYHIELINKQHPIYHRENLMSVIGLMEKVKYNKKYKIDGATFSFHYAGHIPGASSILLEIDGRKILYTGDFNTQDTHLMKGASYDNFDDIDILITEATYGDRPHPRREEEEEKFLGKVGDVLQRGGNVLIPAFAVGRAQEVIEILSRRNFDVPIYLDGMAKKVSNLYKNKPEFISNHQKYSQALSKVKYIKKARERKEIVKEQSIIITTSGMLDGGPVIDYLGYFYHNPKNGVFLTGYQGEGSNGRLLMDEGRVFIDGTRVKMKAEVEKFDFSAHAGREEIVEMINTISPKNLVLQHGDTEPLNSLYEEFKDKYNVVVPGVEETIDL